ATRIFIPELVDFIVPNHPSVLSSDGHIAIGLLRGAGVRVLPEGLVLTVDFNSRNGTRTHVAAQHELLVIRELVIQSKTVYCRAFKDGKIPNLRRETVK